MESIMSDLIPLFRPQSVALIGASSDTKKYGYWTAKSLIDNKFQGEIHLISRSGGEILGQPTYPDILSVPGEVDLAIIAIAPKHILPIIEQCVEKGVKTGIVVSTGFGETGPEGKEIERRMLEIARKGNMRIMGPNCMGMYSSAVSLHHRPCPRPHEPRAAERQLRHRSEFQRQKARHGLQLLGHHRQPDGCPLQ